MAKGRGKPKVMREFQMPSPRAAAKSGPKGAMPKKGMKKRGRK